MFDDEWKMSELKICKCGWMPAKVVANFGSVAINPNSDKPYTADRFQTFYTCINPNCEKSEDAAIDRWNKKMEGIEVRVSAAEILKMIETVDPADTAKLDEIDARVLEYINANGIIHRWSSRLKYTRSRDALKAIRPEGWTYSCGFVGHARLCSVKRGAAFHAEKLPSEELAELHAIIQAIEYERGIK